MSLLSTASRLNTANQLSQWNDSCKNSINTVKSTFSSIVGQLELMKTNPEYTQEDIDEVTTMLVELRNLALSLTE